MKQTNKQPKNDSTATNDVGKMKEEIRAQYGENKTITDDNYDKSLAVKCINGTFVGTKTEDVIVYKGIPFVGQQPVGAFEFGGTADPLYECRNFAEENPEVIVVGITYRPAIRRSVQPNPPTARRRSGPSMT